MPYPAQVDKQKIVETAQKFIEDNGVEQLSLAKLAKVLNIKAPSLYRHVKGKDALLREVNLRTIQALIAGLVDAVDSAESTPQQRTVNLLISYRQFAHKLPNSYLLAFDGNDKHRPDDQLLQQLIMPLQASVAAIAGEAQALAMLRGAFALVHGFVVLELTNQLRRGGDLAATFEQVATAYVTGWDIA